LTAPWWARGPPRPGNSPLRERRPSREPAAAGKGRRRRARSPATGSMIGQRGRTGRVSGNASGNPGARNGGPGPGALPVRNRDLRLFASSRAMHRATVAGWRTRSRGPSPQISLRSLSIGVPVPRPAVLFIKFEISASGRTTALRRYATNRAYGGRQQMYLRALPGRERCKSSAPSRVLSFPMLQVGRRMKLGLSIPGVDTLQARYRLVYRALPRRVGVYPASPQACHRTASGSGKAPQSPAALSVSTPSYLKGAAPTVNVSEDQRFIPPAPDRRRMPGGVASWSCRQMRGHRTLPP
jgi:hypothetical protein